jgi:hypothetical protein
MSIFPAFKTGSLQRKKETTGSEPSEVSILVTRPGRVPQKKKLPKDKRSQKDGK